jgi:hypothetical protein
MLQLFLKELVQAGISGLRSDINDPLGQQTRFDKGQEVKSASLAINRSRNILLSARVASPLS